MSTIRISMIVAAAMLITATMAEAQATRTWVSGVGDDANPCSRTAPCKTFAGAISKTAAGGEINALDPGGYGTVTITKSISIVGDGTLASILSSAATAGITVSAGVNDVVVIRGIEINGAGSTSGVNGIRFLSGRTLHVEDCRLYGFSGKGIEAISPTAGAHLFVKDTIIRNAAGGGILLGGVVGATIDRARIERNSYGLRAEGANEATIVNSSITGNSNYGIVAVAGVSPISLNVDNTVSAHNGQGGIRSSGANASIRLSNTTIMSNTAGLVTNAGGAIVSFGTNRVFGNGVDGAPTSSELPD